MDQAVDDPTKTAERPAVRVAPPSGQGAAASTGAAEEAAPSRSRLPDWWHRDHPVFVPLAGFFAGMVYIIVVPGLYAAVLKGLVGYERAEELFPFVLATLAVPLALLVPHHTRKFGRYMLIGVLGTAVVVLGVAAVVLYVLISRGS